MASSNLSCPYHDVLILSSKRELPSYKCKTKITESSLGKSTMEASLYCMQIAESWCHCVKPALLTSNDIFVGQT